MDDKSPKSNRGGKRSNAGRKATKNGKGKSVYIPNELLETVENLVKNYYEALN